MAQTHVAFSAGDHPYICGLGVVEAWLVVTEKIKERKEPKMKALKYVMIFIAALTADPITCESHSAEQKPNPLVSAADSSISWFEKILRNWELFIQGREKQKLKSELQKLEVQLNKLQVAKEGYRNELRKALDNGADAGRPKRIQDTLFKISNDLKQYTVDIANLSGYVPDIRYEGATNSLALPQEQLGDKSSIVSGLWGSDARKVLSTQKALTEEQRQTIRKSIEEADKAIGQLKIAKNKVKEIRQRL
jgi:hypothetical protein